MHTKYFHSISIACRRSSSSLFVLSLALFTANLLHFNALDEVKTLCSDHDERDYRALMSEDFLLFYFDLHQQKHDVMSLDNATQHLM